MSEQIKRVSPNFIHDLAKNDFNSEYKFLSPVNLKLNYMTKIELPELKWINMDSEPQSTKVANTGQTVIVSGTWPKKRPRITGGPLLTTYAFSQLHYHWGSDNTHGSEHSYNDKKVPLEMHAVFLKEKCKKQEEALGEKDGAVVISYAYKLNDEPNPGIKLVCDELPYIPNPSQLIELENPVKLTTFALPFQNDYFVYWGSVRTNACKHVLLWILCRQPYAVSEKQLEIFRSLFTSGHQPIMNNARHVHNQGYEVFHVNPSAYTDDVLYKKTENNVCKKVITMEKIKEMKRQRSSHGRYVIKSRHPSNTSVDNKETENKEEPLKNSKGSCVSLRSGGSTNFSKGATKNIGDHKKSKESLKEPVKKQSDTNTNKINYNRTKRQSCYRKFFSLQDKSARRNNDKYVENPGKGDITVMSVTADRNEFPSLQMRERGMNENRSTDNTEKNQIKKDSTLIQQIKSQYSEVKAKLKNDIGYNGDKEENINSLKFINKQHKGNLEINDFYIKFKERVGKAGSFNMIEGDRDKLDIIHENALENWEKNTQPQTDSREVTFNKLNLRTPDNSNDIACFSAINTKPLKEDLHFKTAPKLNFGIESNEPDNESYKDCCEELNEINNDNYKGSTISTATNKVVQDIGINTMSLNELLVALSKEYDHETKKFNKLIRGKSGVTLCSGDSNGSRLPDNNAKINKTEKSKQPLTKECQDKTSKTPKKFSPIKSTQIPRQSPQTIKSNRRKSQSNKEETKTRPASVSSQDSSASNKSDRSIRVKAMKSKSTLRHSRGDSEHSSKSSGCSIEQSYSKNKPKKETHTKSKMISTRKSIRNSDSKENIKYGYRRTSHDKKNTRKTIQGPTNRPQSREARNPIVNYASQTSKRMNSLKRDGTREGMIYGKATHQRSKSPELMNSVHELLSQHSSLSQRSGKSSDKCHSLHSHSKSNPSTHHSNESKYMNRPSTPAPEVNYKMNSLSKSRMMIVNNTLIPKCSYSSSSSSSQGSARSVTSPMLQNASIQTRMSNKYEEMRNQKYKMSLKCDRPKQYEKKSKFLMCKDSLQMLEKSKGIQSAKIPQCKSILQKRKIMERPQSVTMPTQISQNLKTRRRPRTMESHFGEDQNLSETYIQSNSLSRLKSDEDYANYRTINTYKRCPQKIPSIRPPARPWKY